MSLALFDFDGTLCTGDSIVPYLRYCVQAGIAPPGQYLRAAGGYVYQRIHPEAVSAAKAKTLSFIRGRNQREMDEAACAFWKKCLAPRFLPSPVKLMYRCISLGMHVVVLSASPEVYMRMLPHYLPAEAVLCTPCLTDETGCYTGEIGPNCRDEEKCTRLASYLREEGIEESIALACGDSLHDVPMLRLAQRQYLVQPSRKLAAHFPNAFHLT